MPSSLVPKISYGPSSSALGSFTTLPVRSSLLPRASDARQTNAPITPRMSGRSDGLGHLFQSSTKREGSSWGGEHASPSRGGQHASPSPSFHGGPVSPPHGYAAERAYSNQPPLKELNIPEAVEAFRAAKFGQSQPVDDDEERSWETSSRASTVSMPPLPSDDTPLVPIEYLNNCGEPLPWQGHSCAPIVLALLNSRGVFLPANKDIVSYHMAPAFLKALKQLCLGSYFVKYGVRKSAPKERFFSIRMLENSAGITVPYLCWTVHQHAMQLVDKVPLTQFVGASVGTGEVAFQRYMVTGNIIKGCRQGPHHAKLPTHGAFTMWFFDQRSGRAKGLSLLTCATSVYELWIGAMQGILAVNSVSLREVHGRANISEIDLHLRKAQRQVRDQYLNAEGSDDDAVGEFMSS